MSIAMTSVKLSLGAPTLQFKIKRIQGPQEALIATEGRSAEVSLGSLVSGSKIEILVEMERSLSSGEDTDLSEDSRLSPKSQSESVGFDSIKKTTSFTTGQGSVSTSSHSKESLRETIMDDLPILSVDCQYTDPAAGRQIARLIEPRLLMVTVSSSRPAKTLTAPELLRRKAELLAGESMTRACLTVSRNNWAQARKILSETSKILALNLSNAMNAAPSSAHHMTPTMQRKEVEARATTCLYTAILEDLDVLTEGCEQESKEIFDCDHRTYAAQQVSLQSSTRTLEFKFGGEY